MGRNSAASSRVTQDAPFHAWSVADVAGRLQVDLNHGLNPAEVKRRVTKFGRNVLPERGATGPLGTPRPAVRLVARLRIADGRSRLAAALATAFYLPVLRNAFDTEPLSLSQWVIVTSLSLLPLLLGEGAKVLFGNKRAR